MLLVSPAENLDLVEALHSVHGGEHELVRGHGAQALFGVQLRRVVAEDIVHLLPPRIPVPLSGSGVEALGDRVLPGHQDQGALLLLVGGVVSI